MEIEHHRDLAHEFPELKARIHELKLASREFRHLYEAYQALDNEIHRIEQEIETPSDDYTEQLKRRRVYLKDRLHGLLTGRIRPAADTEEFVIRHKFHRPVDERVVIRDWIARGYACRALDDGPGQPWRRLPADSDALVTVVAGRLEVGLASDTYALEAGDELFIPRGAARRVRTPPGQAARWLYGCA